MGPKVFFALPYYSGSHKYWADNILKYGKFSYYLETMAGRHWKWRMQGSAIYIAEKFLHCKDQIDIVLCSTMMDVSLFKSLTNCQLPIVYYMHENQLTYPFSDSDTRKNEDYHYGFINFKSCFVSDLIIFNSEYHQSEFFNSLKLLLKRLPDYINPELIINRLSKKSRVNFVGVDFAVIDDFCQDQEEGRKQSQNPSPTLLWNHRWEHDKNPSLFLDLITYLDNQNQDFQLVLLGENGNAATIKEKITNRFSDKVLFSKYAEQKSEYYNLVKACDFQFVTSHHDYYGLSVLEAIYLNVTPFLPKNKVYNEFIPENDYPSIYFITELELFDSAHRYMSLPKVDIQKGFLINHSSEKTVGNLEAILLPLLS